jgi:hydrogenase maturation protease
MTLTLDDSPKGRGGKEGTGQVVVIGVGNDSRRDDGAGLLFVRELRNRLGDSNGVQIFESDGDPAKLLERWTGASLSIVVDASSSGAAPGTVTEINAARGSNGHGLRHSTHAMGVMEAVQLGMALGRMPSRLRIFAIEGQDFGFGEGVTEAVRRSVNSLAEMVMEAVMERRNEE